MRKKTTLILLIVSVAGYSQQKDSVAVRFSNCVSKVGMSKNLYVLASDEYEGRETGKHGQKMAAEYIAKRFEEAGIPPYKDKSYFQEFPLNIVKPMPAEVSIKGSDYTPSIDFYTYPGQSEQTLVTKEVLFLGYGIDDENYSDYKPKGNAAGALDVKDKVVMVLAGEPTTKDSMSVINTKKKKTQWTTYGKLKTEKAKAMGIRALLVVVDDVSKDIVEHKHRLESESMLLELSPMEMPVVYISKRMANDILRKKTVEEISQTINSTGATVNFAVHTKLVLEIKNKIEKINSENVLGYIEGSDIKNELIICTAHYDHLGKEGDVVYNGADDDGSGTVAVIELATVFAKAKKQGKGPRRSMLFMAVAGEEKGLLGSSYYVQHPVFPLSTTVCDLNTDMIGRLDEKHENNPNYVYVIGDDKLSSELHAISENANKLYENLELDYTYNDVNDKNRFYYRSDHYNFAKNGIPVIFYFNGVHADYHKETDEVEKINFDKMEKITRLVFFTAWELANRNERIKVDSDKK